MAHSNKPQTIKQSNVTFDEISKQVWKHLEDRDWDQIPARDIAISLSLEANELLEHFQWSDNLPTDEDKEALAAELADVLIYAFQFAGLHGIDMAAAIRKKLAKSAKKYPAELFKGKDLAAIRKAWVTAKTNYKKEGL